MGRQLSANSAKRPLLLVSRYFGRTIVARAAAAAVSEIGNYTTDRTRQLLGYATLKLSKDGRKPLPPENGWGDVGMRLGSISAYELQLIDDKIRDVGLMEFADMLGVKDPGELLQIADLRQKASKGDEEAQYALAARFCPSPFRKRNRCRRCQRSFGVTRYRHHCRHCGESFCQEHSAACHSMPRIGYMTPARVCEACKAQLEEEDLKDRIVWRMVRVEAFLNDHLIPYFEPGDHTQLDKALKVFGGVLSSAAKKAPLTSALAGDAMELLRKYGLTGMAGVLLRHEYVEAVKMLKEISGIDQAWPLSVNQLSAAMYYLLAKGRGERGAAPDREQEEHRVCAVVSESCLQELLNMAPLALHFAYSSSPVEMQLKAQQQGWRLIFTHAEIQPGQPGFALLCHMEKKEAALVVRGPNHVFEVISEVRCLPLPFPQGVNGESRGGWTQLPGTERLASCGVAEAAHWLFGEVYPHIVRLRDEEYSFHLLGHSLGGAVAALLGVLLREEGITEGVRCHAFGSPSCVSSQLAQLCEAFCTVVILHDDIVPRITPSGVRHLLRELLQERETVEQHWQDDVEAIIVKSKGRWTPRWRRRSTSKANGEVSSFVRYEGEEETRGGEAAGDIEAGNVAQSGWDSCDDDFADYCGIGCTRTQQVRSPKPPDPNKYSIRNEDGSTTTVDLASIRKRLLANSTSAIESSPECEAAATPPWPPTLDGLCEDGYIRTVSDPEEPLFRLPTMQELAFADDGTTSQELPEPPFLRSGLDVSLREAGYRWQQHSQEEEGGEDPESPLFALFGGEEEAEAELEGAHQHAQADKQELDPPETLRGQQQQQQQKVEASLLCGSTNMASNTVECGSGMMLPPTSLREGDPAISGASDGWRTSPVVQTDYQMRWQVSRRGADGSEGPEEGDEQQLESSGDESQGGVLVEDVNLPELYPPGRIVHIYSYHGIYRACMPDRDFQGLRRVSLQGNMLKDHEAQAYFHALCEVIDVRRAPQQPVAWEGFKDAEHCACCGVDLTWQCAAASEAQRYRDKHNCRCCGRLVCQSCSSHRKALPSMGLGSPARVCDRCFYGGKQSSVEDRRE